MANGERSHAGMSCYRRCYLAYSVVVLDLLILCTREKHYAEYCGHLWRMKHNKVLNCPYGSPALILCKAVPFLVGCPACLRNFLNLFCEMSFSLNKSLFIIVTSIKKGFFHQLCYQTLYLA